jgi:uncharacterized protein DUF6551
MARPATIEISRATSRIETRRLDLLSVDPAIQRPLDEVRVATIAGNFRWEAFGVPTVSRRPDMTEVILDGQHRVAAARAAGFSNTGVKVMVYLGLTREQEAEMFRLLNNTKSLTAIDKFLVALIEKEPTSVAINRLIESVGLKVVRSGERAFKAVVAARKVYETEPDALARTLHICTAAWGSRATAVDSRLVAGLGLVTIRYGSMIDVRRMVTRLAKYAGGADGVIGAARGLSHLRSMPIGEAVADIAVQTYNGQSKTGRIPEWGQPIDTRE